MESEAEALRLAQRRREQNTKFAERSGETLLDLVVDDHRVGLGGRFILTLVKRNRTLGLPWTRLRVGSPVLLSCTDDPELDPTQAVVSSRSTTKIQIAANDWPEGEVFRLDLSADEITRRRQRTAIAAVRMARGRVAELRNTILGNREPRQFRPADVKFLATLNDSQQAAVRQALTAEDISVIHGPPGTGKTTTVIEVIRQAVARDEKVLATAPSNTAVDNLLEQLVATKSNVVRIGHPARVAERLREYSLDVMVENHENMRWVRELLNDADSLYRKSARYTRAKPGRGAKQEMRREAKYMKQEARKLERQAVKDVLDQADVICATTTFDTDILDGRFFETAVIDEACQSTEPGCWQPVLFANRIIFAGDHQQLPPTVISTEAAREGFAFSMLENLVEKFGDAITTQLNVQYRMHDHIMDFSSREFYDGTLIAHESVAGHLLKDLDLAEADVLADTAVTFVDSAGANWDEEIEPDGHSKRNPEEADFIVGKTKRLLQIGVRPEDMAVIAPYAAQVRLLRERMDCRDIEIDTVDGFQGREKEVVLISMVRSNTEGEIGFLSDRRRMNVAMTRARRKLFVVGDSATLGGDEFFLRLLEYLESIGAYHSVWEEIS
ncbi:AAA domain-containing protein [Planctomycetota bacterium]